MSAPRICCSVLVSYLLERHKEMGERNGDLTHTRPLKQDRQTMKIFKKI